jgi:hypothetical protein
MSAHVFSMNVPHIFATWVTPNISAVWNRTFTYLSCRCSRLQGDVHHVYSCLQCECRSCVLMFAVWMLMFTGGCTSSVLMFPVWMLMFEGGCTSCVHLPGDAHGTRMIHHVHYIPVCYIPLCYVTVCFVPVQYDSVCYFLMFVRPRRFHPWESQKQQYSTNPWIGWAFSLI